MTDCAICFSEVTAATGRTVMSCGHEYHMRCLFQWLQKPDGTGNCPCCRHEPTEHERLVAVPSEEDESDDESDDGAFAARQTPLARAAWRGDVALVERLLATGGVGVDGEGERIEPVPLAVLLEERDEDGDTALASAAIQGHLAVLKMLLDAGANIDNRNDEGATPLRWAICQNDDDELCLELLRRGCDVSTGDLVLAAEYDMIHVLQAILERGVAGMGDALHAACVGGSPLCAAALLEAGADPNYRAREGKTPLMSCFERDAHLDIVEALIEHGGNVNATDEHGWNVFMWLTACDDAPDPDVMAALLGASSRWERGADGRWREVAQSWGEGDAAPPPYTLAELTRAAARRIQAAWRGWSTRRRMRVPSPEAEQEAAMALCYLRLQITVPVASPKMVHRGDMGSVSPS